MSKPLVTRLPVQHKKFPHCENCGAPLPTFDNVFITNALSDSVETTILAVTFHVQCSCGTEWDIRKTAIQE